MSEEPWRELVDLGALARWMDTQNLERGAIEDVTSLAGGTQNILLRFRRNARWFVLRRPPRHPRSDGSGTMRREARVLGALADTGVAHPRLIAACASDEVLGAAFYLMEPVDGFNATVRMPALHRGDPAIRRAMGFSVVDGIAALGRVDYQAVGLGDFGRVEGFLERQVARWRKQLEAYGEYDGWPGPAALPGVGEIAAWLDAYRPPSFTPGILHGDCHLANILFRNDGPQVAAFVDWELATVGDPLLDLGWLLATWHDPNEAGAGGMMPVQAWDGFPPADELVARYAEGTSRDLSAIGWYAVLACFKLGIIIEGSHARACAGKAPKQTGDYLHGMAVRSFRRALTRIERH